ncbi:hypothetical protein ACFPL7_11155 [Dongia soli]|uniref:Uncharacterized protein n=1 Tax=Dongia soli TaxID=600628 RepID=A0ABU5EBE0_9PROT|nr:hypothetical protein [Dongia soli]MDY0883508.1 hypothetical protein [Dongia soli]
MLLDRFVTAPLNGGIMFSLPSFPKLFLVVAVVAVVWWWFRRPAVQSDRSESQVRNGNRRSAAPNAGAAKQKAVEDLVKCPSCGTYIAAGSACDCKNGK